MRCARFFSSALLALAWLAVSAPHTQAQVDARMLRQPDVSETHITFVYAGDIWVVPKDGGTAQRLSSPRGEESFPRFSPDGRSIAFTGNYDGNTDVYVIPTMGGDPVRVTHHPMADRLVDWYPRGGDLLYASSMESGRQRYNQFYRTAATGGMPRKLPVPYGEFGAISPDGQWLAYTPKARDFRTWKRYRGGWAPDVWLFNLQTLESRNITDNPANDGQPMWHEGTVYFLSDRGAGERYNLWAYDTGSGRTRQVTNFRDFDLRFPAIGPDEIVFEAGGRIHLLDLDDEQQREIEIEVVTDRATLKPRLEAVGERIVNGWISPSGKRALFEARGEIFTVPAEHGPVRLTSRTPGVAERYPTWSPDGRWLAYFSDRTGEYELTIRQADGSGDERTVTALGAGYRYRPYWSPDSRKLAFVDKAMRIQIVDRETGAVTQVDQGLWMFQGALNAFTVSWSPDSRWLAYSRGLENRHAAVFLFDTQAGRRHQATAGFYNDTRPVFGPGGEYLFFQSDRTFQPVYSDVDNSWVYPNTTGLVAVPLRRDVPSPLEPRSDDEEVAEEAGETASEGEGDQEADEAEAGSDAIEAVEIDLEGFESRVVPLPPEAGNYTGLHAVEGKLVYRRLPRTGSAEDESPLVYYDLEEREEKTVLGDVDAFVVSADGKKALVAGDDRYAIVDLKPDQKMEKPLRTAEMEMTVDPAAEWKQIFDDVWRFQRDFFYDPNMHGVDWASMREQYGGLLDDAVTRWDVNFVIGELIAELDASHTYRGGGDTEAPERRGVGLLGVDWSFENGAYRIERIIESAPWDSEMRSPLRQPGVDVSEGDYVLAVNGIPLDPARDPWSAFQGLAGRTVALTVNDAPSMSGAREVLVETLGSETRLRNLAWIDANRRRVLEASAGRVGYVYVPNTGVQGQTELVRQFAGQTHLPALVIDERWNSGGQIPDRFVELLNRPPLAFWAVRDGKDWQWPPIAHFGPKVMLINGWSGSGGDAFPDYFRKAGLGPLIGSRTWGGLIGITGSPPLMDGGGVTVPTFRMYNPDGGWFAEGHGVDPDIDVPEDPTALAQGTDPQLERAVMEALRLLETTPPWEILRPPYERRTAGTGDDGGN
jgi:tricorn protease